MKKIEHQPLKVTEATKEDVYKDIVRIHWQQRGKQNHVGTIVQLSVDGGRRRFVSLKGLPDEDKGKIRMDHVTRTELKLQLDQTHNFEITKTNAWQKLRWAINATDPAARIAAWIAVWSGVVAILGLILAAWPIIDELWHPKKTQSAVHSPARQ